MQARKAFVVSLTLVGLGVSLCSPAEAQQDSGTYVTQPAPLPPPATEPSQPQAGPAYPPPPESAQPYYPVQSYPAPAYPAPAYPGQPYPGQPYPGAPPPYSPAQP